MIKNKMIYSDDETAFIKDYLKLLKGNVKLDFWNDDKVKPIKGSIKSHYVKEQKNLCCYCQNHTSSNNGSVWDVEHIVPKSSHPVFLFESHNLALSCRDCNSAKSNGKVFVGDFKLHYPIRSSAFRIVHPHFDIYEDHIGIYMKRFYFPKSDKGRATIELCGLLRFSYKFLGWDEGLANDDVLFEMNEKLYEEDDVDKRKLMLKEMLMVGQVHISRNLVSRPFNKNETVYVLQCLKENSNGVKEREIVGVFSSEVLAQNAQACLESTRKDPDEKYDFHIEICVVDG